MKALSLASRLGGLIETLVHPASAADPVAQTHHTLFIGLHLMPPLVGLVVIPLRLASGLPGALEIAAIMSLQVPMFAVLLAMRGGSLWTGQMLSAAGLLGFGALLAGIGAHIAPGAPVLLLFAMASVPALLYATALAGVAIIVERLRSRRADRDAARQDALALACGDLVLCLDRRGAVLSCNDDAGALFALSPRDFSGPGFYERLHLADRPAFLHALGEAFENRLPGVAVLRLRSATIPSTRGDFHEPVFSTVEARMRPIAGDEPRAGRTAICLLRDITAQAARDDDILVARQIAERAETMRERFLANVSHELRTPLNAIIGFADLLRLDTVSKNEAKRAEYADIIASSGHHLLSVVNTILDMSKLEAGSLEIEPTQFDPAALFDGCFDIVRLKALETGVTLVRAYDAALAPIVGDVRACRQIVINLLSNAVKFSGRGGTVTLSARSDFGLSIVVADTGIGIEAGDMPRLGDAFFQASNARSRLYEGTGLGLSLVRGLVGLHGGAIDIESAPGAGTTVTVRLPADCRAAASIRTPVTIHTIAGRVATLPASSHQKVRHVA